MEEESSSSMSSLSPSPSSESIGDMDRGKDFIDEEVYVMDATSPPEEMVTATSETTPIYAF